MHQRGEARRHASMLAPAAHGGLLRQRTTPPTDQRTRSGTPICGAARPTPGAARIVSIMVCTSTLSSWVPSMCAGTSWAGCGAVRLDGGRETAALVQARDKLGHAKGSSGSVARTAPAVWRQQAHLAQHRRAGADNVC